MTQFQPPHKFVINEIMAHFMNRFVWGHMQAKAHIHKTKRNACVCTRCNCLWSTFYILYKNPPATSGKKMNKKEICFSPLGIESFRTKIIMIRADPHSHTHTDLAKTLNLQQYEKTEFYSNCFAIIINFTPISLLIMTRIYRSCGHLWHQGITCPVILYRVHRKLN